MSARKDSMLAWVNFSWSAIIEQVNSSCATSRTAFALYPADAAVALFCLRSVSRSVK